MLHAFAAYTLGRGADSDCIAMLLESDRDSGGPDEDGESRIEALFQQLNADALRFQELYYAERKYLQELDQRRCRDVA